jgi:hypothetical protein
VARALRHAVVSRLARTLGLTTPVSTYGYLYLPTGNCVHFVDVCPEVEDLRDLAATATERGVHVVYVDCAAHQDRPWELPNRVGELAGTAFPPYDENEEPNWLRWWDDLLTLGKRAEPLGLCIVLDNAHVLFERDRKFITTLVESFLHAMKPWIIGEKPYHLHLQMTPCPAVAQAFNLQAPHGDA